MILTFWCSLFLFLKFFCWLFFLIGQALWRHCGKECRQAPGWIAETPPTCDSLSDSTRTTEFGIISHREAEAARSNTMITYWTLPNKFLLFMCIIEHICPCNRSSAFNFLNSWCMTRRFSMGLKFAFLVDCCISLIHSTMLSIPNGSITVIQIWILYYL